jgi:hypothetical protein
MDGCNYEEAFPTGPVGSPGCLDRVSPDESRRQEKKKARRCRGPQATYLNNGYNMVGSLDPDRPSTKRMEPVPALNTATGLREHAPVTQQYNYDTFVGSMDSLPAIRANVEGVDKLQKESAPSFFGASPEDTPASLVGKRTSGNGITESFQSFVNVIGEDDSYMLKPDFTKSFETSGAQKAGGVGISSGSSPISKETSYLTPTEMLPNSILPVPNVDVFWKENGLAGGQSAFFSQLRAPGGQPAGTATTYDDDVAPVSRKEVLTKLDRIFARLDDMDATKSENAQTEILLFILTGLGVIFLMDVGCRAAGSLVKRR